MRIRSISSRMKSRFMRSPYHVPRYCSAPAKLRWRWPDNIFSQRPAHHAPTAFLRLSTRHHEGLPSLRSVKAGLRQQNRAGLVDAQPEGTLHFGHHLSAARDANGWVQLTFSNGSTSDADIVIGADDIHSTLQREIGLEDHPSSEGIMAYRGLIPIEKLSWAREINGRMSMWIGKGRSFMCYAVSRGRLMNMVAFVPTDLDSEESWTAPGDLKALRAEYSGWDDPVLETIGALDQTPDGAAPRPRCSASNRRWLRPCGVAGRRQIERRSQSA
jgi:hypothetical protein